MKLATINLIVADAQRSRDFYVNALGLKENQRRSEPSHFFYLESEGAALTVGKPHDGGAPKASGSVEIGFEVADLQAARSKIESAGVKQESMHWGDTIQLRDPDGNCIVIYVLKRR